jgi:hypothetical protein
LALGPRRISASIFPPPLPVSFGFDVVGAHCCRQPRVPGEASSKLSALPVSCAIDSARG